MWKIISFFNHKWGVWKTTLVHNLAFALADEWKKVLLIDADPQMNLTSAMYGLSTSIEYSTSNTSLWSENTKKYISFTEYLQEFLENEKIEKGFFSQKSKINTDGKIDLISGDINLTNTEANLYGIVKNRNTYTDKLPYRFEQALRAKVDEYDFILVDTSPSASSIINALLVLSWDYFIAPVSPSFFSLQAIDNLSTIFKNWMEILSPYRKTQGFSEGLSYNVKFLGLVVQLAKRFNNGNLKNTDGFSRATEDWVEEVNESVKNFQTFAVERDKSITTQEFRNIFGDTSNPFIIEKCCDFTQKLRTIAEQEWIPVIYIDQNICKKHDTQVDVTTETWQYTKALTSINQSYRNIAKNLLSLI